jgi:hypothetical protein
MAKLSESNTLELRIAFHNAVARFQDWTADVAEPRVKLCGKFCPISEVCEEVANLSDPLPESVLSILYRNTHAGDDALALKIDETFAGLAGICCGSLLSGKTRSVAESTAIVTTFKGRVT